MKKQFQMLFYTMVRSYSECHKTHSGKQQLYHAQSSILAHTLRNKHLPVQKTYRTIPFSLTAPSANSVILRHCSRITAPRVAALEVASWWWVRKHRVPGQHRKGPDNRRYIRRGPYETFTAPFLAFKVEQNTGQGGFTVQLINFSSPTVGI